MTGPAARRGADRHPCRARLTLTVSSRCSACIHERASAIPAQVCRWPGSASHTGQPTFKAITLMISRPLKLAVLMGRMHSGAGTPAGSRDRPRAGRRPSLQLGEADLLPLQGGVVEGGDHDELVA